MKYIICSLLLFSFIGSAYGLNKNYLTFSAEIKTTGNFPLYELEIPKTVYENINNYDLRGVQILNSNKQIVAHKISPIIYKKDKKKEQNMPFFPIYNQHKQTNKLNVNLELNTNIEVIKVTKKNIIKEKKYPVGYIIDTREWRHNISKLTLTWNNNNKSFIYKFKILASNNLDKWIAIADNKILSRLSHQKQKLLKNSIELRVNSYKYLKILFIENNPNFKLKKVEIENITQTKKQYWHTVVIKPSNKIGEYLFKNNLKIIANQLRIKPIEKNTIAKVQVFSKPKNKIKYRHRGSNTLHNIMINNSHVMQDKISLNISKDTNWKLIVSHKNGGLGDNLSSIDFGWIAQKITFIARGKPPFYLTWGGSLVTPKALEAKLNINKLIATNNNITGKAKLMPQNLHKVNSKTLKSTMYIANYKQWILWSLLIIIFITLTWIIINLVKEISHPN